MKVSTALVGLLAASFLLGFTALADDPPKKDDGKEGIETDSQAEARRKLQQLEQRMNRLAQILQKTEPEQAALLKNAYSQSRDAAILKNMDRILTLLESEAFDEAVQEQEAVATALRELLALLLDKEDDLEELLEKIERYEDYKKEVDRLLAEEKEEKAASDQRTDDEEKLAALQEAMKKIDDLIGREEAQLADTEGVPAAPGPEAEKAMEALREKQEDIRADTEELSFEVDDLLESPEGGGEGEGSKTGRSLSQAAEAMAGAEESLAEGQSEEAAAAEKEALDALKEAREAIEKEAEEARKLLSLPKYEEMEEAQEATKKATEKLAQKMKDEGGEENTPGQPNVGKAGDSMQKAEDQLGKKQSKQAADDQQQAVEDLEQAQKELEDALDQLKRELQEELLAALEERFREMLAAQKAITKDTVQIDQALANAEPDRAQKQKLADLSQGENDLADDSGETLDLLREEGSTIVFPEIIEKLQEDFQQVGGWLATTNTGQFTQSVQKDIEQTLEDLIEALQKKQEHNDTEHGPGGT